MPAKAMVRRTDHTPGHLREPARKHRFRDRRRRRMRATALVMEDGLSRAGVASGAGVGARTLRDRVVRYNADGLDGLRDAARPGAPPKLENGQAGEVVSWLDGGPDPDAGGPSRRAVADVRARIAGSFGVGCTLEGARRPVRRLGFRHMSPRPVHPRADPAAREGFGGDSVRLARKAVPDGVAPEDVPVYLQDGARVGQKGMLSRVWARKGTRPRVVRDHRYGHLYLFPPACPATGDAVGHVCGRANTGETDRHLRETGGRVPAGKRALVVPGGAGWHRSKDLGIPDSVSLLRLPPTARSSIRAGRCSPPEASAFRQPGVRRRGTCPGGGRARPGRLHRPEGRDHADHHEGMGGAVRSGAPIGNDLFGLVSVDA